MRIALAQFAATTDPAENLAVVLDQLGRAAGEGATLVIFPEAMSCSFARPRIEAAEPLDGPWASAVRAAATRAGITVIVGMFTPGASGRVRNTLLVTGPGIEASYHKVHLFDALGYRESDQIEPGQQMVVCDLDGVRLGLATCYDVRFPEQFKVLARLGAEVIVVPSSWAPGDRKVEQWRTLVTARALDSTSIVVAVDQALPPLAEGPERATRKPTGVGHSIVAGPLGEIVVELGPDSELALVDLDLTTVTAARAALPVLTTSRFTSTLA